MTKLWLLVRFDTGNDTRFGDVFGECGLRFRAVMWGRYAHVGYISRERLQARRVQDGIKKEMGGAGYTRRIKVRKE